MIFSLTIGEDIESHPSMRHISCEAYLYPVGEPVLRLVLSYEDFLQRLALSMFSFHASLLTFVSIITNIR